MNFSKLPKLRKLGRHDKLRAHIVPKQSPIQEQAGAQIQRCP